MATFDLNDESVVVVIGSGAGGGTLSNELAQKGVDVVCLEAGSRLSLADVENDVLIMNERMGWNDRRIGAEVWLCKTVGGTTMRWSGITPRFQAHEFKARSTYGLLEDTTLIDWPLTLEELELYYDKAEVYRRWGGKEQTRNALRSYRQAVRVNRRMGKSYCRIAELQIDLALVGCGEGVGLPELHGDILPDRAPVVHVPARSRSVRRRTSGPCRAADRVLAL